MRAFATAESGYREPGSGGGPSASSIREPSIAMPPPVRAPRGRPPMCRNPTESQSMVHGTPYGLVDPRVAPQLGGGETW